MRRDVVPAADGLVRQFLHLLSGELPDGFVLDLACGDGHNGLFLASRGMRVILADKSEDVLRQAGQTACSHGLPAALWKVDLERPGIDPFDGRRFAAVLVFRYLHRPLIPCIKRALVVGGILMYETFTTAQSAFGRPRNPEHLLQEGELAAWFRTWDVIHSHEGVLEEPKRAVAQLVCRKT